MPVEVTPGEWYEEKWGINLECIIINKMFPARLMCV